MNFIRATVADGGAALAANGLKLPAPATARGALASAPARRDGRIRPENVLEASRPTRGGPQSWS